MNSLIKRFCIAGAFSFASLSFAAQLPTAPIQENTTLVKAGNKYVTLLGSQVELDQVSPEFTVVDENFLPISLSSFKGKTVLISSVLSIDTPICSIQTKRFNDEAASLADDIVVLTLSTDLPFAHKRYCQAEEIDKVQVLSDAVNREFGLGYGLLIKDMGLLARAILIIDKEGVLRYKEVVPQVSSHPNYEQALLALKSITKSNTEEKTQENIN